MSGPAATGPRLRPVDRLFWTWLCHLWPGWRRALVIVKPDTVLRWHRQGFRCYWRWKSRPRGPGRPRIPRAVQVLIRQMCHANPTWGAPRIHGELLKLGIAIAEATVGHYMVRRRPPPSQTWRTFLTNHIGQLVSVDFFVVPTLTFRVLFVFVVLAHDRRQILHVNVTGYPTAAWTAQQIRNAFPWDTAPRFLLRDRDGTYGHNFRACLEAMEIDEVLTAPQSPWQNPYVERLIGSMRRECVDHVIVLNERSLHRILRSYIDYYHLWRTHLSLGKDAPVSRRVEPAAPGEVMAMPHVGGLAPQLPSSRGLTTAMDGRRRKTVHAPRGGRRNVRRTPATRRRSRSARPRCSRCHRSPAPRPRDRSREPCV